MKLKTKLYLLALYTIGLLALVASCNGQSSEAPQQRQEHTPNTYLASLSTRSSTRHPIPAQQDAPVMVCLLVDFSGSMSYYQVDTPSVDDVLPLLRELDLRGGIFAYGSIHDRPTDPLDRLFIPPPERSPEVETATNPFTRKKLQRRYKRELLAYQAREEERRLQNRTRIEAFVTRLNDFLARGPGGGTDIWSSLTRCQLFLMEDPLYWTEATGQTPERFIVATSDGRHSAQSLFSPVDKSISILVVTGRKGIGNFEKLKPEPTWFENSGSAIRHMVTTINRGK